MWVWKPAWIKALEGVYVVISEFSKNPFGPDTFLCCVYDASPLHTRSRLKAVKFLGL